MPCLGVVLGGLDCGGSQGELQYFCFDAKVHRRRFAAGVMRDDDALTIHARHIIAIVSVMVTELSGGCVAISEAVFN